MLTRPGNLDFRRLDRYMAAVEVELDMRDTVLDCGRRVDSNPRYAEAAGCNLRSCPNQERKEG